MSRWRLTLLLTIGAVASAMLLPYTAGEAQLRQGALQQEGVVGVVLYEQDLDGLGLRRLVLRITRGAGGQTLPVAVDCVGSSHTFTTRSRSG